MSGGAVPKPPDRPRLLARRGRSPPAPKHSSFGRRGRIAPDGTPGMCGRATSGVTSRKSSSDPPVRPQRRRKAIAPTRDCCPIIASHIRVFGTRSHNRQRPRRGTTEESTAGPVKAGPSRGRKVRQGMNVPCTACSIHRHDPGRRVQQHRSGCQGVAGNETAQDLPQRAEGTRSAG